MKRVITWLLAIGLVLSLAASGAIAETESAKTFTAGTYTGTARGREGDVTLEVTFSADAIESIELKEHHDTSNIFTAAYDLISADILNNQSLAVDSVSGATLSTRGIINAVKDCVEQAGGDVDALMIEIPKANTEEALTADVVVVGGGGAGIAAAVEAAERGASVILVEAQGMVGGSTGLSTGMVLVPATAEEKSEHLAMMPEDMVNALKDYTTEYFNEDISRAFLEHTRENAEWARGLSEEVGHEFGYTYDSGMYDIGEDYTVIELVTKDYAETQIDGPLGFWITDGLYNAALKAGVQVYLNTKADELLSEDGIVNGIGAINAREGIRYTIKAKSVVLACGGFGANAEMKAKYTEEPGIYVGAAANDGFGILAAGDLGAKLRYGIVPDFGFGMLYNTIGGVVIDEKGQVLTEDDAPIVGLYSAGEMACVIVMDPPHFFSGHNNAWGLYSGRVAGGEAADYALQ